MECKQSVNNELLPLTKALISSIFVLYKGREIKGIETEKYH